MHAGVGAAELFSMGLAWVFVRCVSGVRQLPGRAADAAFKHQHKQVVTDNFRDALHVDAPSCFAHGRAARLRATKNSIGKMSVQPLPFYQGIT
jgi:hypothetical protein